MGGHAALGLFVHKVCAELNFKSFAVAAKDRGMDALVAVGFGRGNEIFNPARHRLEMFMNNAQRRVAVGSGFGNYAQGDKIMNFTEVIIVFLKFFPQRILAFDASGNVQVLDAFGAQGMGKVFFH